MARTVAFVLDQVLGGRVPASWDVSTLPSGWTIVKGTVSYAGSTDGTARANQARSSGLVYFELELEVGALLRVGFAKAAHANSALLGADSNSAAWDVINEVTYPGGSSYGGSIGSSFERRNMLSVAVNLNTGKWWLGYDGAWFAGGSPSAGTGAAPVTLSAGTWAIACSVEGDSAVRLARQITARPPSGFEPGWAEVPASADTLYVATTAFATAPTDTPAHTYFAGRLKADSLPEIVRGFGLRHWSGPRRESRAGTLDLVNTDGHYYPLIDEQVRDRVGQFWEGDTDQLFADWVPIADVVADRVDFPDERTCRFTLRDRGAAFEVQVQGTLYGSEVQVTALANKPRPIAIGAPLSCPVPLEQRDDLVFGCHELPPYSIVRVRDQGVEVPVTTGWEPAENGFKKLAAVFGQIVADVEGAQSTVGALVDRLPEVLAYLMARRGLNPDDVLDTTSINALDTACPYPIARWLDSSILLSDLLTEVLDSFCGAWFIDRFGVLCVGRLYDPSATTPTWSLTAADVDLSKVRIELDRAPNLSDVWLGGRNWYQHRASELADDVLTTQMGQDLQQEHRIRVVAAGTPHPLYQHVIGAAGDKPNGKGMATLLNTEAHVQAIADHTLGLYAQPRYFLSLPTFKTALRQQEPFSCGLVTLPIHPFTTGRKVLLRRLAFRPTNTRTDLVLWT